LGRFGHFLARELRLFKFGQDVFMATKVRLIKLLNSVQPVERTPMKRPALKPVVLYLMELRSHSAGSTFARKKFAIPVSVQSALLPQPVKIVQLRHPGKQQGELAVRR